MQHVSEIQFIKGRCMYNALNGRGDDRSVAGLVTMWHV